MLPASASVTLPISAEVPISKISSGLSLYMASDANSFLYPMSACLIWSKAFEPFLPAIPNCDIKWPTWLSITLSICPSCETFWDMLLPISIPSCPACCLILLLLPKARFKSIPFCDSCSLKPLIAAWSKFNFWICTDKSLILDSCSCTSLASITACSSTWKSEFSIWLKPLSYNYF